MAGEIPFCFVHFLVQTFNGNLVFCTEPPHSCLHFTHCHILAFMYPLRFALSQIIKQMRIALSDRHFVLLKNRTDVARRVDGCHLHLLWCASHTGGRWFPGYFQHLFCVHYVFLPRLRAALHICAAGWNNHPLRTEGNHTPQQLWHMGHLNAPEEEENLEVGQL